MSTKQRLREALDAARKEKSTPTQTASAFKAGGDRGVCELWYPSGAYYCEAGVREDECRRAAALANARCDWRPNGTCS